MTVPIDTSGSPGALAQSDYMQRTSKVYAIYESEMDTIGSWNEISTIAYSIATSCLGFAISLWVQSNMAASATPAGQAIVALGIPACVIFGVVAGIVGFRFGKRRETALGKIKSESRAVAAPDGE